MKELNPNEFFKAKPLLAGGFFHPEVISILENNNPGWVFVDETENPRTALVWSKGIQGFYLIGDPMNVQFLNSLDEHVRVLIQPRMKTLSLNHFEVSGHHAKWDFESIFRTRNLYKFDQLVFKLVSRPETLKDNKISTISLKDYKPEHSSYLNNELITNHIGMFWSTYDQFSCKGFGFAAVEGSKIIGVCYSSFTTTDTHSMGIETEMSYQGKGVGLYLASLTVQEIFQNGFTPYWDCSLSNLPSRKIAERLGFRQVNRYTCYGFAL